MRGKLNYFKLYIFLLSGTLCLAACSLNQRIAKKLNREFNQSKIVNQYHVGFALYDPLNKELIYGRNADSYFTPASNVKLFTLYAGLKMIPDSIPSIRYVEQGDSLIFWGTGDPSFLHTELKGTRAFDFLKHSGKALFFAPDRYSGAFYGNGWAWDDYNDYYQAEITELPLMDNLLTVTADQNKLKVSPPALSNCVVMDSAQSSTKYKVQRDFDQNLFRYPVAAVPADYRQQIPYRTSTVLTLNMLSDTLRKRVGLIHMPMPATAKTVYNMKSDSVFKLMLLNSDNFIAEQLLLVYSNQLSTDLSSSKAVEYVQQRYLGNLPGKPSWVDGSGLSRGNLFTPREMIAVLDSIYVTVHNDKKLFDMLPAGGKAGTLKNAYPKTDKPFVFGKTGSLSNIYNQSGYVLGKKGKVYIFSFMNNNFVLPSSAVRAEIARIVTYIHENF